MKLLKNPYIFIFVVIWPIKSYRHIDEGNKAMSVAEEFEDAEALGDIPPSKNPSSVQLKFAKAAWEIGRSLGQTTCGFAKDGANLGLLFYTLSAAVFLPQSIGLSLLFKSSRAHLLSLTAPQIFDGLAQGLGHVTLGFTAAAAVISIPVGLIRLKTLGRGKFFKVDDQNYSRYSVNKLVAQGMTERGSGFAQLFEKFEKNLCYKDTAYLLQDVPQIVKDCLHNQLSQDDPYAMRAFQYIIWAADKHPVLLEKITPDMIAEFLDRKVNSPYWGNGREREQILESIKILSKNTESDLLTAVPAATLIAIFDKTLEECAASNWWNHDMARLQRVLEVKEIILWLNYSQCPATTEVHKYTSGLIEKLRQPLLDKAFAELGVNDNSEVRRPEQLRAALTIAEAMKGLWL